MEEYWKQSIHFSFKHEISDIGISAEYCHGRLLRDGNENISVWVLSMFYIEKMR